MFTSLYLNNVLNSIYERSLRLIYNDHVLPLEITLEYTLQYIYYIYYNIVSIKNILLAIKINKFQEEVLKPLILIDLFVTREKKHNLRNFQALKSAHNQTVTF